MVNSWVGESYRSVLGLYEFSGISLEQLLSWGYRYYPWMFRIPCVT